MISAAIQTIVLLAGIYGMVLRNDHNNRSLKTEVHKMQDELKKLADVVIQQAVQTTKLDNLREQFVMLQKTVEELRRGTGFIQHRRHDVDGEYPDGN